MMSPSTTILKFTSGHIMLTSRNRLHNGQTGSDIGVTLNASSLPFRPPNVLPISHAARAGRTAARQLPRRTQTRLERTAAGVRLVQVDTTRGGPAAGPTNGAASACAA